MINHCIGTRYSKNDTERIQFVRLLQVHFYFHNIIFFDIAILDSERIEVCYDFIMMCVFYT